MVLTHDTAAHRELRGMLGTLQHTASDKLLVKYRDCFAAWINPWVTGRSTRDQHGNLYALTLTDLVSIALKCGLNEPLDIMLWYIKDAGREQSTQPSSEGLDSHLRLRGAQPLDVYNVAFTSFAAKQPSVEYSLYQLEQVVRVLVSWEFKLKVEALAPEHAAFITPYMEFFMGVQREHQARLCRIKDMLPKELKGLVRLPFLLVGQSKEKMLVVKLIAARYLTYAQKPFVLMLGGVTGHGKTETAVKMAGLMADRPLDDTNYVKIPCASIKTSTELFGLSGAYKNADKHSQLNAFITTNSGKYAVCILDEFEKLEPDAKTGLLEAFSEAGSFVDKTTQDVHSQQTRTVDCSKMLFILTTNIRLPEFASDSDLLALLGSYFVPEVVSRIDAIRPFGRFSKEEKLALILHMLNQRCHVFQRREGMQPETVQKLNTWLSESGLAHPSSVPFQHRAMPGTELLAQMQRLLSPAMTAMGVRGLHTNLFLATNRAVIDAYVEGPSSSGIGSANGSADGKTWQKNQVVMFDMKDDAADVSVSMFATLTCHDQ